MVILYSTHCPKCTVLETKLKNKEIEFEEISDVEEMLSKGISSVPYLEVEGKLLNFSEAVKWVNGVTIKDTDCESCNL